jgi:hypothetical protein
MKRFVAVVFLLGAVAHAEDRPVLGLSAHEVESALSEAHAGHARHVPKARELVRKTGNEVSEIASTVAACYRLGARDEAESLTNGAHGVYAFDSRTRAFEVTCHFRGGYLGAGGVLDVEVIRREAKGPFAVAFPPGTYARPDPDGPQELTITASPVVVLGSGEERKQVTLPMACASFLREAPNGGALYKLTRFERGSPIDRLMVALCAREETSEAEAQLAVWLTRDDPTFETYKTESQIAGQIETFRSGARVLPEHGTAAARLMLEGEIDPRTARFFGETVPASSTTPSGDARP